MSWPTVGRDSELGAIDRWVDAARRGDGRFVLVEGVAGAGKTHLLDAAVRAIDQGDGRITVARARVPVSDLAAPFAAPLAALDATLADLGVGTGGPRSMIEAGAGDVAQAVAIDGLLRAIEDRCLSGPLVLCLDDVHAADQGTVVWLDRLAERVGSLPLLVLVGARPPVPGTAYEQLHAVLTSRHTLIPLQPLDPAAVIQLVVAVLGSPPGRSLSAILERAEGLPLFVTAILERVPEAELVRGDEVVELGEDIASVLAARAPDAVADRVRAVAPELRLVLLAAAVLGETITAGHVQHMLGIPLIEVIDALDALERSGLLVADGVSYGVRHELYRQAVLEGASGPARAALHAAAATARAERGEPAVLVARHLVAAGTPTPSMSDWLLDAAETIVAYEPQNALDMIDVVIRGEREPSRRAIGLRGRALASIGRVDEAEALLRRMLRSADSPAEELRLRRELALALFQQGRPAESMVEMVRVVELAPDEVARARARAEESFTHLLVGGFERAGELAAEQAMVGVDLGDLTTEAAASMVLCLVTLYHGRMSEALALADRLEHLTALEVTSDAAVYQPWFAAGMARVEADDHVGARRIARIGQQRCIEAGYQWMIPGYDALATYCSLRSGELGDAIAEATAALDWRIADRLGVAVWCHAFIARACIHRGELERADLELAAAGSLIEQGRAQLGWDHIGLAHAALSERRGDLDAAYRALADPWDLHEALGVRSAMQETAPELVRLESLLGRRQRTEAALALLDGSAEAIGDATRLADRARARAWMHRDADGLEEAILHARRAPRRLVTATALAELAEWSEGLGSRRVRADAASAAAELFTTCGAIGDLRRLEPFLSKRAGRTKVAVTGPSSLSRTENMVVALLADGLANADIAARLHISRRTVESHVSSAYRKLGVSNRVELARIGLRLRDADTR